MATITNKLIRLTAADPLGRQPDPWASFREIEIIELQWAQTYRHSLGKYSRFFVELENKRFLATRCPICSQVWAPPRPVCPDHLAITEWVELSGRGRVESFSILHHPSAMVPYIQPPYVLAYVRLEGADTLFAHLLRCSPAEVHIGLPVQVVYYEGPVAHPIHLMAFEPDNG
ncbi:MAG: Zn-ribbon domain-containing OB-fold protein [Chloroflexi bacterium]|nr:Zn-ribbon domain-containing OB-fold protein [Chloroflexota bacterium]